MKHLIELSRYIGTMIQIWQLKRKIRLSMEKVRSVQPLETRMNALAEAIECLSTIVSLQNVCTLRAATKS